MPIKDRDEKRRYQVDWRAKRRQKAIDDFGSICNLCGNTEGPFEFDHIDRETKKATINRLLSHKEETLNEELKKCQLLCIPCHREKTTQESIIYDYHGVLAMYRRGCRCQSCKDANAKSKQEWRAKDKSTSEN